MWGNGYSYDYQTPGYCNWNTYDTCPRDFEFVTEGCGCRSPYGYSHGYNSSPYYNHRDYGSCSTGCSRYDRPYDYSYNSGQSFSSPWDNNYNRYDTCWDNRYPSRWCDDRHCYERPLHFDFGNCCQPGCGLTWEAPNTCWNQPQHYC